MASDSLPGAVRQVLTDWADTQPTVLAVHVFGSRARGNALPDSDLDLALEFAGDDALLQLVVNRSRWKSELSALTGIEVKDIQLRTDPVVSGPILTICRKV